MLALDLATTSGYALSSGPSGTVSFREYVSDYGRLDVAFRDWLVGLIVEHGVTKLAIEAPIVRGSASFLLMGLYWSANSVGARMEVQRRDADTNAWREHILGRARLLEIRRTPVAGTDTRPPKHVVRKRLKAAVIEWAKAQGHSPTDDNHADALGILAWAKEAA